MKKTCAVTVLMAVMFLCSMVQAFDGPSPRGVLSQLSADKEMLFHQTMRGVFDATANIREQIKGLETEIRGVLTATEFSATLFLEKRKSLQALHETMRQAMDEAMAKLASQFTAEERSILAEVISRRPGPPGPPPGR